MAGPAVTHCTDVLEETGFFLDATVNCGKPVIIAGAMRPSTAISADGPFHLLEAVTVAASPSAMDRGAMVVMNDRIASAYYVTNPNVNTMDTFKAMEIGFLGLLISNTPYFFCPPVKPTGKRSYSVSNITSIPRVDILMACEDMSIDTLDNAVSSGAKLTVVRILVYPNRDIECMLMCSQIAGAGAGGVSTSFNNAMEDVINNYQIPIVQSTCAMSGEVPSSGVFSDTALHIASGYPNPMKPHILLGILLAYRKNMTEIADAFLGSTNA